MDEMQRNVSYESLRNKMTFFSGIAGTLVGVIAILLFGPTALGEPAILSILWLFVLTFFGSAMFALFVYHNIWFRQLSLPAALVGAIYSVLKFSGQDLVLYLYLSIFAIVIRVFIGFIEACATTRRYADFWRSFMFHPLNWGKEFGMKTFLE